LTIREDKEINRLLRGSRNERDEAIRMINRRHKRYIWAIIRKIAPNLSTHDAADIYQEVFLTIISISDNNGFRSNINILPYIGAITRNKTVDRLRQITRKKDFQDKLKDEWKGSDYQENSESSQTFAEDENEVELMLENIREAITKMPHRQKQTATIIAGNYPKKLTDRNIAAIISDTYGEQCSEQAVKRARQEMQKKLNALLYRQQKEVTGYVKG
jgi:RNA polymerase sigma factor (sigma-70 family)